MPPTSRDRVLFTLRLSGTHPAYVTITRQGSGLLRLELRGDPEITDDPADPDAEIRPVEDRLAPGPVAGMTLRPDDMRSLMTGIMEVAPTDIIGLEAYPYVMWFQTPAQREDWARQLMAKIPNASLQRL